MATAATSTSGWQRVGAFGLSAQLGGIAASPAGYVVLEDPKTVWFSSDGTSWTPTVLPFEAATEGEHALDASAITIAGGPDGFVVAGSYDYPPCSSEVGDGGPPPCRGAPISWASADGLTWQSSLETVLPLDGKELPEHSVFAQVWPAGDGWDAAVEVRASVVYRGNTLLHSQDGLTWSRSKPAPLPDGISGRDIFAHGGVATGDGRRVLWQIQEEADPETTLATSPDGVVWTVVSAFDGTAVSIRAALGPDETGDGTWLLLGEGLVNDEIGLTWWSSDDLHTWRSGVVPTAGLRLLGGASVTRSRDGYVAVGMVELTTEGPGTVVSTNGTAWSTFTQPAEPDSPIYLVAGPAGVIGVGFQESGGTAWRWVDPGP